MELNNQNNHVHKSVPLGFMRYRIIYKGAAKMVVTRHIRQRGYQQRQTCSNATFVQLDMCKGWATTKAKRKAVTNCRS